jgi:hypothetical protein
VGGGLLPAPCELAPEPGLGVVTTDLVDGGS